jgi:hypothetical protein
MGTENQGLAMMLGVIALLFLVLLVVSYIVGDV